jgi:recombinational DNA repair protein (RecF pathway)
LLTQASIVSDTREVRTDLSNLRKFLLFIEILDHLLVSEQLSGQFFHQLLYLRELFLKKVGNHTIRLKFSQILQDLGFTKELATTSISQQVSSLLDQKLYSFEYLRPQV